MAPLFGFEPIDFPSEMVPSSFRLDLPPFGLGPSSKGRGSNLWLSANKIALFHWTLDLGPLSKVALTLSSQMNRSSRFMKGKLYSFFTMSKSILSSALYVTQHNKCG